MACIKSVFNKLDLELELQDLESGLRHTPNVDLYCSVSNIKSKPMAINRLANHTGKTKHTTKARLADFYLNPFTFVGYRNNCFFSHTANPYILTVTQQSPMDIFLAQATGVFIFTKRSNDLKINRLKQFSPPFQTVGDYKPKGWCIRSTKSLPFLDP